MTRSILERIELTFQVAISKALKIYCLSYYHGQVVENLVLNKTERFWVSQFSWFLFFCSPIFSLIGLDFFGSRPIKIAELQNYSTDEKRDIYKTFDMENQKEEGLPIDPFDLMNRLKQAGTMNNATTPSDALDEALNAFDESEF